MNGSPVIAGTDGSDASLRAVEWAASEAALRGMPLRIVSVPAMPPGWPGSRLRPARRIPSLT